MRHCPDQSYGHTVYLRVANPQSKLTVTGEPYSVGFLRATLYWLDPWNRTVVTVVLADCADP